MFATSGGVIKVYSKTLSAETFLASGRSLLAGLAPTYNSGGDLTQLSGTAVFDALEEEDQEDSEEGIKGGGDGATAGAACLRLLHVEETTGGHRKADELAKRLLASSPAGVHDTSGLQTYRTHAEQSFDKVAPCQRLALHMTPRFARKSATCGRGRIRGLLNSLYADALVATPCVCVQLNVTTHAIGEPTSFYWGWVRGLT